MNIKVKDFLDKWNGEWRIENQQEGVLCDFSEGVSQFLEKNILRIKLDTPWNCEVAGEIVIIIED